MQRVVWKIATLPFVYKRHLLTPKGETHSPLFISSSPCQVQLFKITPSKSNQPSSGSVPHALQEQRRKKITLMGRGKIEIRKIENANSRQVTFSKRRAGLLKKAFELGVLCDAQVAVIIFSNTGKLFEYASDSMHQILARYNDCLEPSKDANDKNEPEETKEDVLKKEIERLEMKQLQLLGKNLTSLGLKELKELEHQLNESLLSVKDRKEQILLEQLELSRIQEQRALDENQTLRIQITELTPLLPSTDCPTPVHIDYHPVQSQDMSANATNPDRRLDYGVDHEDTHLRLGLSSPTCEKRKAIEAAEHNIAGAQKRKRRTR